MPYTYTQIIFIWFKMATPEKSYDLAKFQLTRILYNNSKNKSVCVLGSFVNKNAPNENALDGCKVADIAAGDKTDDNNAAVVLDKQQAIIILEKTAFTENDVNTDDNETTEKKRIYFSSETKLKQQFINDIYGNFECFPSPDINSKLYFLFRVINFEWIVWKCANVKQFTLIYYF